MEIDKLPDRIRIGADEARVLVDTPGLLVLEVRIPAGGGPPVLHRHAPDEVYRVLDGELALHLAGDDGEVRRVPASAGDAVHIPAGTEHTVRNESGADARALAMFAPGAPMAAFLRAVASLEAPTPDAVGATAARHGIEMTRPL